MLLALKILNFKPKYYRNNFLFPICKTVLKKCNKFKIECGGCRYHINKQYFHCKVEYVQYSQSTFFINSSECAIDRPSLSPCKSLKMDYKYPKNQSVQTK